MQNGRLYSVNHSLNEKQNRKHNFQKSSTEQQFMDVPISQKQLLLNPSLQQDNYQFVTISQMDGFTQEQIAPLKQILSLYFSDITLICKETQKIIFNSIPPIHYPRAIKQSWNKKSKTVLMAKKHLILQQIYEAKLSNVLLKDLSSITIVLLLIFSTKSSCSRSKETGGIMSNL